MNRDLLSGEYKRFPKHWDVIPFTKAFKDMTGGQTKIPKGDYLERGDIPIIDQGQDLIGGYTNEYQAVCDIRLPCVLFGDHTKIFKFVTKPFALGADGVKVLSEANNIDPKFAYYFLNTLNLPDVGYSRHFRFLKRTFFPLPPLEEQRRIAAILDKADGVRRKRKEAIRLTEELLKSTFLEMFGDPVTNPKGWEICSMKKIVVETQYGTAEKSQEVMGGLPILRMNNITYSGEIDLNSLKWCQIPPKDEDKFTVKRGDLLFNRTNSPELVGKTAVWRSDGKFAYAGYLIRVRFDKSKANSEYVSAFLNSNYGKRYLLEKAKPSINMSNFSASEFLKIPILLPDIETQHRFDEFVSYTRMMSQHLSDGLGDYNNLFNSLLQRAFRGEL